MKVLLEVITDIFLCVAMVGMAGAIFFCLAAAVAMVLAPFI